MGQKGTEGDSAPLKPAVKHQVSLRGTPEVLQHQGSCGAVKCS